MSDKNIHIVSFDVPFPADYGGVIDIYYRIKALYKLGFKITLHCFEYGRGEQKHLEEITEKIYYYKRKKTFLHALNRRPLIVASRRSNELLDRLLEDNFPILFEGIHCGWFLENKEIQKRLTIVRTHNIEHDYYKALAQKASFLKRIYFNQESKKLKRYEPILTKSKAIFCIKESDTLHFNKYTQNTHILPASTPETELKSFVLTEEYALFNGKLSVSENENAAIWIIEHIWKDNPPSIPLIIAGKNPSKKLVSIAVKNGVKIIQNPSKNEMDSLISKARIHVLVSDQSTGIKLKLLSALQTSGHVIVNSSMVEGTNLGELCIICESPSEFKNKIAELSNKELEINTFIHRQEFLNENYNTLKNCGLFTKILPI